LWSGYRPVRSGAGQVARAKVGSHTSRDRRPLLPGGTVLLHDTDRTSAPGSWRRTLVATRLLLDHWGALEVPVGPLGEHW
jgi:hypothetical protein